jgi:hypothetical protein
MKKTLLSGLLFAASGIAYLFSGRKKRGSILRTLRSVQPPESIAGLLPRRKTGVEAATRRYMMYFMLPLWLAPGLLDWVWHRKTKISSTSGTTEGFIHSLMMAEVGAPIVAGLLLEVNAGLIALMIAAFFIHEATAFWDVSFAVERRKVLPREQHTHSFLEVLPFCAVSFIICMHWDQFLALVGFGNEPARFGIRLKRDRLPTHYVITILSLVAAFIAVPYGEELCRCWKAERQGLVGRDTPECAPKLYGAPE